MEYNIIKDTSSEALIEKFRGWGKLNWKSSGPAQCHVIANAEVWHQTITRTSKKAVKSPRFVPPTLEAVQDYIKEKKWGVNANAWMAYYEKVGWMINKKKMVDWKAGIKSWQYSSLNSKQPLNMPKPKEFKSEFDESKKLSKEEVRKKLADNDKMNAYNSVGMMAKNKEVSDEYNDNRNNT